MTAFNTHFEESGRAALTAALECGLPRLIAGAPDQATTLCHHGLSGVVAALADAGAIELEPALHARVRDQAVKYTAQLMAWQVEWRRVLSAEPSLPVLVLKGAALAHLLYPQPHWRMLGDLDLLIRPEDCPRFEASLETAGYHASLSAGGDLLSAERQYVRRLGPRLESRVDLHWALSNRPVLAAWADWPELWAAAVEIPALGAQALGLEHALLQACVHRSGHHRGDDRLIWLLDLHLLWARLGPAGRARAAAMAQANGIGALLGDGLAAASAWFGTEVDGALSAPLRALGQSEPGARLLSTKPTAWQDLMTLRRWRQRGRYLRQLLFPPRAYMQRRYPGKRLLPVLYLRRFWNGLRKALAGQRRRL